MKSQVIEAGEDTFMKNTFAFIFLRTSLSVEFRPENMQIYVVSEAGESKSAMEFDLCQNYGLKHF